MSLFLDEPRPRGRHDPQRCPACGEPWVPAGGSRLTRHARCYPLELQIDVVSLLERFPVTQQRVRRDFGLSSGVLRLWIDNVRAQIDPGIGIR